MIERPVPRLAEWRQRRRQERRRRL